MTFIQIIFLLISAVTIFSAVLVVGSRKIMHAAMWLILSLLGVAALFALLETRFFVVVQVIVYIGAIAILIIFAIMLTRQIMDASTSQVNKGWWLPAILSAVLCFGLIVVMSTWDKFNLTTRSVPAGGEDLVALGMALVNPQGFLIPFEVASVLLLAAMIGAIYIAYERKGGQK